ncbi:MAG TPA: hypothetical protein VGE22_12545 [Solimonas sp.]
MEFFLLGWGGYDNIRIPSLVPSENSFDINAMIKNFYGHSGALQASATRDRAACMQGAL